MFIRSVQTSLLISLFQLLWLPDCVDSCSLLLMAIFFFFFARTMLPSTLDPTILIWLHFSLFSCDSSMILSGPDWVLLWVWETYSPHLLLLLLPLLFLLVFTTIFIDFLLILFLFNLSNWFLKFWIVPLPPTLSLNNVLIRELVADL